MCVLCVRVCVRVCVCVCACVCVCVHMSSRSPTPEGGGRGRGTSAMEHFAPWDVRDVPEAPPEYCNNVKRDGEPLCYGAQGRARLVLKGREGSDAHLHVLDRDDTSVQDGFTIEGGRRAGGLINLLYDDDDQWPDRGPGGC